jgi:hypothetical protein
MATVYRPSSSHLVLCFLQEEHAWTVLARFVVRCIGMWKSYAQSCLPTYVKGIKRMEEVMSGSCVSGSDAPVGDRSAGGVKLLGCYYPIINYRGTGTSAGLGWAIYAPCRRLTRLRRSKGGVDWTAILESGDQLIRPRRARCKYDVSLSGARRYLNDVVARDRRMKTMANIRHPRSQKGNLRRCFQRSTALFNSDSAARSTIFVLQGNSGSGTA